MPIIKDLLMYHLQSYDEYTELASKGNPYALHFTRQDVVLESQDQSEEQQEAGGIYGRNDQVKTPNYIFPMGKAMGKSRGIHICKFCTFHDHAILEFQSHKLCQKMPFTRFEF